MTNSKDLASEILSAFALSRNSDEFCRHLVHRVLRHHSAVGALIGLVGADSKCRSIGKFGDWRLPTSGVLDLWSKTALAESMRTGSRIWISSPPLPSENYMDSEIELEDAQSFLYLPLEQTKRLTGFLVLGFAKSDQPSFVEPRELEIVGLATEYSIMFGKFRSNETRERGSSPTEEKGPGEDLTDRQASILQRMSELKTNNQIGREMNLSESSIKQETVKIFRKLGVGNRHDAREKALQIGLI